MTELLLILAIPVISLAGLYLLAVLGLLMLTLGGAIVEAVYQWARFVWRNRAEFLLLSSKDCV